MASLPLAQAKRYRDTLLQPVDEGRISRETTRRPQKVVPLPSLPSVLRKAQSLQNTADISRNNTVDAERFKLDDGVSYGGIVSSNPKLWQVAGGNNAGDRTNITTSKKQTAYDDKLLPTTQTSKQRSRLPAASTSSLNERSNAIGLSQRQSDSPARSTSTKSVRFATTKMHKSQSETQSIAQMLVKSGTESPAGILDHSQNHYHHNTYKTVSTDSPHAVSTLHSIDRSSIPVDEDNDMASLPTTYTRGVHRSPPKLQQQSKVLPSEKSIKGVYSRPQSRDIGKQTSLSEISNNPTSSHSTSLSHTRVVKHVKPIVDKTLSARSSASPSRPSGSVASIHHISRTSSSNTFSMTKVAQRRARSADSLSGQKTDDMTFVDDNENVEDSIHSTTQSSHYITGVDHSLHTLVPIQERPQIERSELVVEKNSELISDQFESDFIISKEQRDNGRLADRDQSSDDEEIDETKYPATRLQQYLYHRMYPSVDHSANILEQSEESMYIWRTWYTPTALSLPLLRSCVLRVLATYPVLRTRLFRNPLIIDADIEGRIDTTVAEIMACGDHDPSLLSLVEEVHLYGFKSSRFEQIEEMDAVARRWARTNIGISALKIFVFTHCMNLSGEASTGNLNDDNDDPVTGHAIMICISRGVGDDLTASFTLHEILRNHQHCLQQLYPTITTRSLPTAARTTMSTEQLFRCRRISLLPSIDGSHDFCHHAYQENDDALVLSKRNVFFRAQCFETKQESVDPKRRQYLEAEVNRMETESSTFKTQLNALQVNKTELGTSLHAAEQSLSKIDEDKNSGKFLLYTDSETGEALQIGRDAQKILHRMILNDNVPDIADENQTQAILLLLHQHQISPATLEKFANQTFQSFVDLNENDLLQMSVVTKEKRKILALTTFVRNRIRECVDEQSRLRYTLERSIIKFKRDILAVKERITLATTTTEKLSVLMLKYCAMLNPPIVEMVIPVLSIPYIGEGRTPYTSLNELNIDSRDDLHIAHPQNLGSVRLAFQDFIVSDATVTQMQRYHSEWKATRRRRQRANQAITGQDGLANIDIGSDDEEDALSASFLPQSLAVLFFATFIILLKHVSGKDLFIMGVRVSQRKTYYRSIVHMGPLTNVVPLRIDLRDASIDVNDLLAWVDKALSSIQKQSIGMCGAELMENVRNEIVIRKANKESALEIDDSIDPLAYDFKVVFEYVDAATMTHYRSLGLSLSDITGIPHTDMSDNNEQGKQTTPLVIVHPVLLPSTTASEYDLLLQVVEDAEHRQIVGVLWHRENIPEHAVRKWVAKFHQLIESFDIFSQAKKMTVANLISRFYHSVWGGGVATDASGRTFSVKELRASLNGLLDSQS